MMLVKNPAGYDQVINLISHDVGSCKLACLLNDRFADGTDISSVSGTSIFEALAAPSRAALRAFLCRVSARTDHGSSASGVRAGAHPARIEVIREYDRLLGEIAAERGAGVASCRPTPRCSTCAAKSASTPTSRRCYE